jgi:hypothetical protein
MAKGIIQFLAETSGFCCQWAFMTQLKYKKLSNKKLGEKLGVSERTVCEMRGMVRDGASKCRHKKGCQLELCKPKT